MPAGGDWLYNTLSDQFTDAKFESFTLHATDDVSEGIISGRPAFSILCAGGKWTSSALHSPVVLSAGGEGGQLTILRTDGKEHFHTWRVSADFKMLLVDKGATKELIHGTDVRIKFSDAYGHEPVATFAPAGLDVEQLARACGAKTFR